MPSVPLLISLLSLCQSTMRGRGHPEKAHSSFANLSCMISFGVEVKWTIFSAPNKRNKKIVWYGKWVSHWLNIKEMEIIVLREQVALFVDIYVKYPCLSKPFYLLWLKLSSDCHVSGHDINWRVNVILLACRCYVISFRVSGHILICHVMLVLAWIEALRLPSIRKNLLQHTKRQIH